MEDAKGPILTRLIIAQRSINDKMSIVISIYKLDLTKERWWENDRIEMKRSQIQEYVKLFTWAGPIVLHQEPTAKNKSDEEAHLIYIIVKYNNLN